MPKKAKSGKPIRKAVKAKKVVKTPRRVVSTPPPRKKPVKRKETGSKPASRMPYVPKINDWVRPITAAKYWAERIGQIISVIGKGAETTATVRFQYSYVTGKRVTLEQWAFPLSRCVLVPDFHAIVCRANPKDVNAVNPNVYQVSTDEVQYEEI